MRSKPCSFDWATTTRFSSNRIGDNGREEGDKQCEYIYLTFLLFTILGENGMNLFDDRLDHIRSIRHPARSGRVVVDTTLKFGVHAAFHILAIVTRVITATATAAVHIVMPVAGTPAMAFHLIVKFFVTFSGCLDHFGRAS